MQKSLGLVILVGLLGCGCEPVRHYNRLQVAKFAGGKLARKPYGTPLVFRSPSEIVLLRQACGGRKKPPGKPSARHLATGRSYRDITQAASAGIGGRQRLFVIPV